MRTNAKTIKLAVSIDKAQVMAKSDCFKIEFVMLEILRFDNTLHSSNPMLIVEQVHFQTHCIVLNAKKNLLFFDFNNDLRCF